ncbi:MAG: T9SS C-terminal target domain-containing protein, partial [Flavobacteriia bacterium]|nr:T9SS C-terminal target domain-containing protein [Flavobacteriia bacterium]
MRKLLGLILILGLFSCKKELGGGEPPVNVPLSTTLSGTYNETITLTADKVWTLKGYVYITNGSQLRIQPGTKIISDVAEKGALCIERGAQIIAEGTAQKPIVFTSGKPDGEKAPGDWG